MERGTALRRKPKLPRKRKKACIKAQGRESYMATVRLAYEEGDENCKFWVNSTVTNQVVIYHGLTVMMPVPSRYW